MVFIGSLNYDEQIQEAAGIVIYGGGKMLPHLLAKMEQLELSGKIKAIGDADTAKQGEKMMGISVLSPEDICKKYKELDYIVYNQYFMEICERLNAEGIKRIHLIRQGSL